jgi:hypothetical protein
MASLESRFQNFRGKYEGFIEIEKRGNTEIDRLTKENEEHKTKKELLEESSLFLQKFSENVRKKSIGRIVDVVNSALKEIFYPKVLKMCIDFQERAGRITADIFLEDSDGNKEEIIEGHGGGTADVVSVILRVLFKKMLTPNIEGPIILDENLKFLNSIEKDRNYILRCYKFLKTISDDLDVQFIIVTNSGLMTSVPEVRDYVDRIIIVKQEKGISNVEVGYDREKEKVY